MDLIKREYHIALFDTYKELLTEKQQEYFILYYYEDLSLKEIADFKNVSRNAVFDQIKKVINILEEYEEKLKVFDKSVKLEEFATKLDADLSLELLSIIKE
jgi:predicted DNA-binding protein YlxM (UPF0122 family)